MHRTTRTAKLLFAASPSLADPAPVSTLGLMPSGLGEDVGLAAAFLVSGTAVVILLLGYFLKEDRYRRPPGPERGVGFVASREAARVRVSALAPRVLLIAEKEAALSRSLTGGTASDEARREAETLISQAVPPGLWERFVAASSRVDEEPERALDELGGLSPVVETALGKLGRAGDLLGQGREDGGGA